jgi:DNA-binding response OmpR family regulator
MLQTAGFEITTASSGREALERCKDRAFDLILSDITMPHMDGWEFVASLREQHVETPVLFMTGGFVEIPPTMNTVNLIRKPFTKNEMLAAIEAVQSRRENVARAGRPGGS